MSDRFVDLSATSSGYGTEESPFNWTQYYAAISTPIFYENFYNSKFYIKGSVSIFYDITMFFSPFNFPWEGEPWRIHSTHKITIVPQSRDKFISYCILDADEIDFSNDSRYFLYHCYFRANTISNLYSNPHYNNVTVIDTGSTSITVFDSSETQSSISYGSVTVPSWDDSDVSKFQFTSSTGFQEKVIRYAKTSASGANDGTSWADAYQDLKTALENVGDDNILYVAEGTYNINSEVAHGDRIMVFGGFPYGGTFEDRNINQYTTTIDLQYAVATTVFGSDFNVIDGFTIRDSKSSNVNYIFSSRSGEISIGMIKNIVFYCVAFIDNLIYMDRVPYPFSVYKVNFELSYTTSTYANCIYNKSVMNISRCLFWGNSGGPPIYREEGFYSYIERCVFYSNSSRNTDGVAIYTSKNLDIRNCLFYYNYLYLSGRGTAIAIEGASITVTLYNSIVSNNIQVGAFSADAISIITGTLEAGYNDLDDTVGNIGGTYTDIGGNISADPLLKDPTGQNFRLQNTSPCIDAGDGDEATAYDYDSLSSQINYPGITPTGTGTPVYTDIGPYETQLPGEKDDVWSTDPIGDFFTDDVWQSQLLGEYLKDDVWATQPLVTYLRDDVWVADLGEPFNLSSNFKIRADQKEIKYSNKFICIGWIRDPNFNDGDTMILFTISDVYGNVRESDLSFRLELVREGLDYRLQFSGSQSQLIDKNLGIDLNDGLPHLLGYECYGSGQMVYYVDGRILPNRSGVGSDGISYGLAHNREVDLGGGDLWIPYLWKKGQSLFMYNWRFGKDFTLGQSWIQRLRDIDKVKLRIN